MAPIIRTEASTSHLELAYTSLAGISQPDSGFNSLNLLPKLFTFRIKRSLCNSILCFVLHQLGIACTFATSLASLDRLLTKPPRDSEFLLEPPLPIPALPAPDHRGFLRRSCNR
jgi:hypothetical protein